MFKRFLTILIVISMFGVTKVCFAEDTGTSKTSLHKPNTVKTMTDHKDVKSQERTITNEAEYAEMVKDYERKLAQHSTKSKVSAKARLAVSSTSSSVKPSR